MRTKSNLKEKQNEKKMKISDCLVDEKYNTFSSPFFVEDI